MTPLTSPSFRLTLLLWESNTASPMALRGNVGKEVLRVSNPRHLKTERRRGTWWQITDGSIPGNIFTEEKEQRIGQSNDLSVNEAGQSGSSSRLHSIQMVPLIADCSQRSSADQSRIHLTGCAPFSASVLVMFNAAPRCWIAHYRPKRCCGKDKCSCLLTFSIHLYT